MKRPLLVDLCCKAGGCSLGYAAAGFDVIGVDIDPQPRYQFKFKQADVLSLDLAKAFPKARAFHASPPCQVFSVSTKRYRNQGKQYVDVLTPLREKLLQDGRPFVIENVPGAPMRRDLVLCGEMFGLRVIRHRWFEIERAVVLQPPHMKHQGYASGLNGTHVNKERQEFYYYTVCGHGRRNIDKVENWRNAMGIRHMIRSELSQAVPPVYTEYIGRQLITQVI